tara:strand:+ start:452 stop:772 length:321 start_codon:yes stop_codon:yes gene_type:complete
LIKLSIISCIERIASFARFERPFPIEAMERCTIKKTASIVIGNAKEKRLRVGAERVITPMEIWIRRSTTANGSMIRVAEVNIKPAAFIPAEIMGSVFIMPPIGKNS